VWPGTRLKAEEALKFGILDRIVEGDLLAGAVAFAREVANKPASKTRERNEKLGGAMENALIFSSAREAAAKKPRGLLAPLAAIDAVEAATKLSFEEGCKVEQKLFLGCLFSQQSKSSIHVFFSEREVSKIPDIPKETAVIPIQCAAVVGAGTMGSGIAMVLANAGMPVLIKGYGPGRARSRIGHDPVKL
jgi:3-hydroxyacyl-CoA dehydrogenase